MSNRADDGLTFGNVLCICAGLGLAVLLFLAGMPWYCVYLHRMKGKAVLAKAEYSKRVAVQEANAKKDSAVLLAQAEVERAKGVAQANKIIGQSLEDNPEYLTWLWIESLREGGNEVVYVPTEAGIPIFDAGGRFQSRVHKKASDAEAK